MSFETDKSFHTISRRSGSDELVPSRYALQVGAIEVLVISDGVLPLPATLLGTNADPASLGAWLEDRFLPPDVFEWPLNVVVVRSGDRTILVDAGLGDEFPDFPRAGRLLQRLDAAGVNPESITDVVLTHLHMDHVGGLNANGLKSRLSPDVVVHLAAAEAEFWASPSFPPYMPPAIPPVLRSAARKFLDQYASQFRTFETETEIAPGVIVRRNGGHTPGHAVVRLESRGQRMTFAGDTIFPDHFDRPYWFNAFDHDPEEAVRVRVNLLRELAATREPLLAAHLSFPSVCRVAVDGNVFRAIPASWEY